MTDLSPFEHGFLIGLIEGEGTIGVRRDKNKYPYLGIANTDRDLLEYAKTLLSKIDVRASIYAVKARRKNRKPYYMLEVYAHESTKRLIPILSAVVSLHRKRQLEEYTQKSTAIDYYRRRRLERRMHILKLLESGRSLTSVAIELGTTKENIHGYRKYWLKRVFYPRA